MFVNRKLVIVKLQSKKRLSGKAVSGCRETIAAVYRQFRPAYEVWFVDEMGFTET